MPDAAPVLIVCSACERTLKAKRLVGGWKRGANDTVFCPDCWRKKYILRAVAIPIASPLDTDWEKLRAALRKMFIQTTACSNWMITQLYARDIKRDPAEDAVKKMPAMTAVYLYPEARLQFPNLPSQTVAAIERAVTLKYKALRYKVVWTCGAALPSFRYPIPFPVHNQSWSLELEDSQPVVSVRIGDGRLRLRLKSGHQFKRQLAAVRTLASGDAFPGELAIYERGTALMVKMVAWLPRKADVVARNGTLTVKTGKDCLLYAVNQQDETIWTYNADHLRRAIKRHASQLQRWSEDTKFEQRPTPLFADRRAQTVRKHRDRMDSWLHQIAAHLAGFADRRRFATVRYDDTERGYLDSFPWFRLSALIYEKLDAASITFEPVLPTTPIESKST